MVFSSVVFVFYFLPLFLTIYYLTGIRNAVLLTGSAVFYVWGEGIYLLLLLGLLVFNRAAGVWIEQSSDRRRALILSISILANVLVLGIFKYSQFIVDVASQAMGTDAPRLGIHLPLGISFFIFQLVSYLVEVHRRSISAERSFVRLSTYVMMFPHLVAGPIVRYTDIEGELKSRSVTSEKIGLGIQYFVVGLCQKVMIANAVAPAADHLFGLPPGEITTSIAWLGTVAYTLQIYFDFCGYSNMAIGLAFMLGFRFPKNFDYPYASRSITEFWRRWHMSLSFWFRDYVYIPLGGSRGGHAATVFNLAVVFFVTGLWHGAAWTFIIWGLFHGLFVILERLFFADILRRIPTLAARCYTLLVVMIGWVLFRADNFGEAKAVVSAMFGFGGQSQGWNPIWTWMTPECVVALCVGSIICFPVIPALLQRMRVRTVEGSPEPGSRQHTIALVHILPAPILLIGAVISMTLLAGSLLNPFLYFRF